jgi:hypothetical protein
LKKEEIKEAFDKYDMTVETPGTSSHEAFLKYRKIQYLKNYWELNEKLPSGDTMNDLKSLEKDKFKEKEIILEITPVQRSFNDFMNPDNWKGQNADKIKNEFEKFKQKVKKPDGRNKNEKIKEADLQYRKIKYLEDYYKILNKLPTNKEFNDLKVVNEEGLKDRFEELARAQGMALGGSS